MLDRSPIVRVALASIAATALAAAGGAASAAPAAKSISLSTPPPTVAGLSPATGTTGALVTITGTSFTGARTVEFGSVAASFTVDSSKLITAKAPAGKGSVDVTVATPSGKSAINKGDRYTYTTGAPPFSLPSPVSGRWQLNGTAEVHPSGSITALRLTSAVNYEAGSAFYPTPVPGTGITAAFDAYIGWGTGADGLTLTLANASATRPTALGVNGGGEGFSGIDGYAVSLDTWKNSVNPSNNFVGIANGPVPGAANELNYVETDTSIASLRGILHHFVVTTSSAGITVTMDGAKVLHYAATLPPYVLVGFSGGTGGFNDIHAVENVAITTGQPPPAPTITGVSPNVGAAAGSASVTITGTNLLGTSSVDFGVGNPADTYSVVNSTKILAATPPGSGTVNVVVTTPGGASATSEADQYTYISNPPTVTGANPTSGPLTGGTTVTIKGTGFTDATSVDFGPTDLASTFTTVNDTTIIATAPGGPGLGTFDVQVANIVGMSATSTADHYTYVSPPEPAVTNVTPASGDSTGGASVTVTGTGLNGATSVEFGAGNPSPAFTVDNSTNITAIAPAGAPGALVDVTVTTPGGTSAAGNSDRFTYTAPAPPSVSGVSPSSAPSGTLITVTGGNLTGATAVDFGPDHPATSFTVSDAKTLYVTAPPGSGTVGLTVTTAGGTSAAGAADSFTYTRPPPPTVTAVGPSAGFDGYSVVVTGTNFTGASAVDFGNASATFTVNSAGSISATAPAPAGAGTVDVTVVTPGGKSATGAADRFTYSKGTAPPSLVGTYRGGITRSGYYPSETELTSAGVADLQLLWTDAGGTGSYAQPIVADNMVYWGDWNGYEHGTSLSGTDNWTTFLGVNTDNNCSPAVAGISGTATAAKMGSTPVLYVPGGTDDFYALDAVTGAVIWKTNLGTPPGDYLWSSPVLYDGNVYEGVSSFGDCPLVQGQVVEMDALTGVVEHTADTVPDGCVGGGEWSSPVVDPSDGSVYVTTGTPNGCGEPELAPAIIKLRASDLTVLSDWTVPADQLYEDLYFGSTPTLFTAIINGVQRRLVGALDKNGIFYAWDRSNLAAGPVWQTRIADPSGSPFSIVSATWDGSRLYVGGGNTIINGTSCTENISALDPATGGFIWRSCVQGFMTSGIIEVPGVLVMGYGASGVVLFLNPSNGATLRTMAVAAGVQGETTVSDGVVYVPLDNGNLIAIGP